MFTSAYLGRSALLLAGTALSAAPALGQATAPAAAPSAAPAPAAAPAAKRVVKSLRVEGSQRIEPETVLSYTKLRVGQPYDNESVDQAIRDLLESDLFADATVAGVETGDLVLRVRENPIINRVILEGNKRLKSDKIQKEIKLAPRQVFSRTAVRQDVGRIIELYRRQGRFAAAVDPKMVALDQNRVDVVFEITEGPKSQVRQINIIGNKVFSDDKLREQMYTKQARIFRLLSSNTSYDQDRLAADQQKLRQFYLTEGYADFRVTSAVAELTPDKRDFIITYVVEEGPRYHFGDVSVDSEIRDFDNKKLAAGLPMKKGDWYNAKLVEDSIDQLNQAAGLFGYAFTDTDPEFQRDHDTLTMGINFHIAQAQRTYVERVDVTGNNRTQDKVVRREFRLNEGDAFNTFQVKRSQDRINSLGYFQDKLEVKQDPGSSPDRVLLSTNVEEKPTGSLTLSAGYSSLEHIIIQASIEDRNFGGRGQDVQLGVNYSSYSKSIDLGFQEPYLFDKNIALGVDIFRRDYNAFNYNSDDSRNQLYSQTSTGFQVRTGVPLTEYWSLAGRYGLSYDQVTLDDSLRGINGECDPFTVGRYLCDSLGNRLKSSVGSSLIYDSLNSRLRPTAGQRAVADVEFAGLGGDVKYLRATGNYAKYYGLGRSGFVFSLLGEGGYIKSLESSRGPGIDRVRIIDRFYLGEPQFRGFDIRGVGPRVQRDYYTVGADGTQVANTRRSSDNTNNGLVQDDPLGGKAYYLARAELEIPLGAGARELGLRPSIYAQVGSLFSVTRPLLNTYFQQATDANGNLQFNADGSPTYLPRRNTDAAGNPLFTTPIVTDPTSGLAVSGGDATTCAVGVMQTAGGPCVGTTANTASFNTQYFNERFLGDSPKPRLTVGIGVNWNSPFGPLRIDVAKALLKQRGDDPKLVTFNVGTQF